MPELQPRRASTAGAGAVVGEDAGRRKCATALRRSPAGPVSPAGEDPKPDGAAAQVEAESSGRPT